MVKIPNSYDKAYIWTGPECIGSENKFHIWCGLLLKLSSAYFPKNSAL